MSPTPKRIHQKIEGKIFNEFYNYLKLQDCEVYQSPFDVVLVTDKGSEKESNTVVQPDICIICDENKLTEAGCTGAPDLIVEILSQSTAKKDYNEKFNLYEENGVKEYWIVDPRANSVETYILSKTRVYELQHQYEKVEGILTTPLFPNFELDCKDIFN